MMILGPLSFAAFLVITGFQAYGEHLNKVDRRKINSQYDEIKRIGQRHHKDIDAVFNGGRTSSDITWMTLTELKSSADKLEKLIVERKAEYTEKCADPHYYYVSEDGEKKPLWCLSDYKDHLDTYSGLLVEIKDEIASRS
jgi:hypothetical protein